MFQKILFSADHYFHIGSPHLVCGKPCEDYAVSGAEEDFAYAVVSDGCSSGGRTDVGSRILALSTAKALLEFKTEFKEAMIEKTRAGLFGTQAILGLSLSDLYATCLLAAVSSSGGYVSVFGDGAVVKKFISGRVEFFLYEWEGNMPYYLAYQGGTLQSFISAHGNNLDIPRLKEKHFTRNERGEWENVREKFFTLGEGICGAHFLLPQEEVADLSFIALFSDGISAIESVSETEAVDAFLAFKNTRGEFVKRRAIREVKDIERLGKRLQDDFGMAVIEVAHCDAEE